MADKRISQLIERTDIANNDVLPIVASGATTTNKVTISTIQDWMQENLDVGVTSVGLSMPSAFTVTNSPVTASGNIAVAGAGSVSQYIRGDGSLADFPSISGGGSSVSYYLNGSVSQGTIGGIAYTELSKVPILGAGTDFTINADGYIASFITDAGDPSLLQIPGGNWNFETYFQASSGGGSPTFYVELYKVNSGGTATLIATSSGTPELIAFGTNITPYFSTLAVPTTTLALTDRLAIRYYVTHSGRTITLHTENNTLCQIITTFTTGLTALNGLTAQVQNFATGTSGTDFNISSSGTTHTFNIPSASADNRGLITTGSQTIAGAKTFSVDAVINGVNVGRGAGSISSNTRVGVSALQANTTGNQNTAVGTQVLNANTSAAFNTGIGYNALLKTTTGSANTAVGAQALVENTTGPQNTAVGVFALQLNTTAAANTAIGWSSLYTNTTGLYNTGLGSETLYLNSTGSNNTAAGRVALRDNTTGSQNAAFGNLALYFNTTGSQNTGIGYSALGGNTTGINNVAVGHVAGNLINSGTANITSSNSVYLGHDTRASASGNTNEIVIGHEGRGNGSNTVTIGNSSITNNYFTGNVRGASLITTADSTINQVTIGKGAGGSVDFAYNTAIGSGTLVSNTTGVFNTAVGFNALANHTTGNNQVALGLSAGRYIISGANNVLSSNSVYIGNDTRASASGNTNEIVIGNNAIGGGSNTATLGNPSIISTILNGQVFLSGSLILSTTAPTIQLIGANSGVKSISYTNSGGGLHWSLQTSYGASGQQQPYSIRNMVLGSDAILIQPASNNISFTGALNGTSASFTGNISAIGNSSMITVSYADIDTGNNRGLRIINSDPSEGTSYNITAGRTGQNNGDFVIRNTTTGVNNLFFNRTTGAATFSSDVNAGTGFQARYTRIFEASAQRGGLYPYNIISGAGTDYSIGLFSESSLWFAAGGGVTKNMTITSTGNVGIGTASPSSRLHVQDTAQGGATRITVTNTSSTQFSSASLELVTHNGTSTSVGSSLFSTNNDFVYGTLLSNQTNLYGVRAGGIRIATAVAPIVFSNGNADIDFAIPRLSITSGGNVIIGDSSTSNTGKLEYASPGVGSFNGVLQLFHSTSNVDGSGFINFYRNSSVIGSIGQSGTTAVVYNTTSDYRLKEDLQEVKGLEKVQAIKVYDYKWITDDYRMDGVLAHELAEVLPYAVTGEKDELYEDGTEKMQGVDYSKIVPILIKAIQEQQEQIDSLKNQIK
jgi:hypothetical protein